MREKRKFSSEFKAKIALASLREDCTVSDLCEKYSLHPNQIYQWRNLLVSNAGHLFEKGSKQSSDERSEATISELNKLIGEITVENNFLKKKLKL